MKFQYFSHLMRRANTLEKTLRLGKIEDRRRQVQQMMRWLDSITDSVDMNLSKLGDSGRQRNLACHSPWGHRVRHDLATKQQQNIYFSAINYFNIRNYLSLPCHFGYPLLSAGSVLLSIFSSLLLIL